MDRIMIGQVGVYRVAAELMRRGWTPYLPVVDNGVDLTVDGSVRIQVKSTVKAVRNAWGRSHYQFTLRKAARYLRSRKVEAFNRRFSGECDFVVCHAIDDNRFWVVPAAVFDGKPGVLLSAEGRTQWKDIDLDKADTLRSAGRTIQSIADEMGVSFEALRQRLKTRRTAPTRKYTDMNQYLDRWDLIGSALRLVKGIDSLDNEPLAADTASLDKLAARQ